MSSQTHVVSWDQRAILTLDVIKSQKDSNNGNLWNPAKATLGNARLVTAKYSLLPWRFEFLQKLLWTAGLLVVVEHPGYTAINLSVSESYFSNSLLFRSPASAPKLEANTGHLPEATGSDWPLKPSCFHSTPRAAWMLTDVSNSAYQALGSGLFQHHLFWWPYVSSKTDAVSSGKKAQLMELFSETWVGIFLDPFNWGKSLVF